MNTKIKQNTKAIILGLVIAIGAGYVSAWTGPTQAPTDGNVAAPINVGTSTQTKLGSLILNAATPIQNAIGLAVFGTSTFNGKVQIADGAQGAGKVLISDSNGVATWAATSSLGLSNNNNNVTSLGDFESKSYNTTYQAPTDGFVIVQANGCDLFDCYGSAFVKGFISSTVITNNVDYYSSGGGIMSTMAVAGGHTSFSMPVKRGKYWRIAAVFGDGAGATVSWMPFQ